MVDELSITPELCIDGSDIEFSAIRAQGAGGQNVNKVATAVQLRFDVHNSTSLPDELKARLLKRSDQRLSKDGILTIKSQEHRTQARNREAALRRLADIIRETMVEEKPRRETRPPRRVVAERIDTKRKRGQTKRFRGKPPLD